MSSNHSHVHASSFSTRVFLAIIVNTLFIVLEFFYGFKIHSSALVADAGHNLVDIFGMLIFFLSQFFYNKKVQSSEFTFGLKPFSIISTLINALLTLSTLIFILIDSIDHFFSNESLTSQWKVLFIVGLLAFLVNIGSSFVFIQNKNDINQKSVFLHLLADALGSIAVVIGAILIVLTQWSYWDPVIGLIIFILIAITSFGSFKEIIALLMNAVPKDLNIHTIRIWFQDQSEVESIHALHVWKISSIDKVLTIHLVLKAHCNPYITVQRLYKECRQHFAIQYVTIQIEPSDGAKNIK